MLKIFIDGAAGTTGLELRERLAGRDGVTLIELDADKRKDAGARREALNACDIAALCLPDAVAIEAVGMIENPHVRVIDASTAHRVAPGWAYGFPELSDAFRAGIRNGSRVAVTGCHASGFIALVYPLIEAGVLDKSALLTCFSLSGYSGGGKKMIAEYESPDKRPDLYAPRQYGVSQVHKHLPEMKGVTGLDTFPVFCPIVDDYYRGMEVTVPLFAQQLACGLEEIRRIYADKYRGPVVRYVDALPGEGLVSAGALAGTDGMYVSVYGNDARILLVSLFDNLGKGASGCAVQCLNIMTGADETQDLTLPPDRTT